MILYKRAFLRLDLLNKNLQVFFYIPDVTFPYRIRFAIHSWMRENITNAFFSRDFDSCPEKQDEFYLDGSYHNALR